MKLIMRRFVIYLVTSMFIAGLLGSNAVTGASLCDPITTECSGAAPRRPGRGKAEGPAPPIAIDEDGGETAAEDDKYPEVVVEKVNPPTGLQAVDTDGHFDLYRLVYTLL